jgi:hypothetical protein
MTATPDITPDTLTRQLLDDLLWLHACSCIEEGLQDAMAAMLADYTDDPNRYSDGSEVWEDWTDALPPGYSAPNPRAALYLPPHRRTAERPGHTYGFKVCTADVIFRPIVRGPEWYEWEAESNAFDAAMRAGSRTSGIAFKIAEGEGCRGRVPRAFLLRVRLGRFARRSELRWPYQIVCRRRNRLFRPAE